jgi:lipopolysaccharide transport protein LptA
MQEYADSMQVVRLFRYGFAASKSSLIGLICSLCLTLIPCSTDADVEKTSAPQPFEMSKGSADENFIICEWADHLSQDEKTGVTVLTGNVRLKMSNGFLNADKVTLYRNVETDELTETIAEGNVEMQEGQAIASSDSAVFNHINDTVNLHDNVVVVQNEDRMEAAHTIFNRRTGVQTAEGKPVKISRPDGFLNGNKVEIYKNLETDKIIKIIAQEQVELRDDDIFATSGDAVINQVDDTVDLRDNVVVIQEEDRLEAKFFTYNRRTGKRVGKGGVRFRVRINQKKEDEQESNNAK